MWCRFAQLVHVPVQFISSAPRNPAILFHVAKDEDLALPAVNVAGSDSINTVLEAAATAKSPVMVQFSSGGAGFYAGKGCRSDKAMVLGAISGAKHVHMMAEACGVPVDPAYRPCRA